MKNLFLSALAVLTLTITSCSRDNEDSTNNNVVNIDPNNFQGTLTAGQSLTLDPSVTYKLTGPFVVQSGATVTFPAGTVVEATGGTSAYIAIAQGGLIYVNGTSSNPVIMTSANATPAQSDWGGLVICGKAVTNKGGSNGESATAEVSNLTYGGNDNNDSSGVIRYLRVEYTGAAFSSDKEFNGVSLFAVGAGTVFENVQAYMSGDDGIEWFGGTLNAKYLVSINDDQTVPGDDIFDWTEGWTGSLEFAYGKRTNNGNRGIEADNNSSDQAATPVSNPTIKNITLIGNGAGGENQGIKLRVGTKANFDNVVLSNWGTGFDVQAAPDLSAGFVGTSLIATNVRFDNVTTNTNATAQGIYSTESTTATGAGSFTSKPSWAQGWTVGF